MSFDHPTAPANHAGQDPDPITPAREARARELIAERQQPRNGVLDPLADFFQWHVIRDDVLVYSAFHTRTPEEQDAIRIRRRDAMKNSSLPWIVSDLAGLMTFFDDIDDLGKTRDFLKEYALDPLRSLFRTADDANLSPWERAKNRYRATCDANLSPREGKQRLFNGDWLDLLGFLGLQALKTLFPSWRFFALAMQAAQTTAWMFGLGLQAGPIVGAFMETAARGLGYLGLPFDPSHNKYNQIASARITQRAGKGLAASQLMHPEDRLTAAAGIHAASSPNVLPYMTIRPDDYPDFGDAVLGPPSAAWNYLSGNGIASRDLALAPWWQALNLGKLAASIPYNIGAGIINELIAPALQAWSDATGGSGALGPPGLQPDSRTQALATARERGMCPGPFCGAEFDMTLTIANSMEGRRDRKTGKDLSLDELLERLRWSRIPPPTS